MRKNHPTVDEQSIDDLVAGQLSRERYREVICALNADPRKWRDCALAFLEDQALRAELRELAKGTINWGNDSSSPSANVPNSQVNTVANTNGSLQAGGLQVGGLQAGGLQAGGLQAGGQGPANLYRAAEEVAAAIDPVSKSGRAADAWPRIGSKLLSTAALLMVSFTVGWLGSELLAERERMAAPEVGSVADNNSALAPTTRLPSVTQSLPIQPQYVRGQTGQFMPLDHEIPQSIRELERRGRVHLESQEGLVPQRMSDGTTVFIPVQEVRVIPATLSF